MKCRCPLILHYPFSTFNLFLRLCVIFFKNMTFLRFLSCLLVAVCLASCAQSAQVTSVNVTTKLSEEGRALLPIVVAADAGEREKSAAQTLAKYLSRISGGEFKVEVANAALTSDIPGIVLGTVSRFASPVADFKTGDLTTTEDYLLRSHRAGVVLIGASELALEHAVWDFLYRLGYRQFFPGETWEIVPNNKNLTVAVNAFKHPDFYARRIWYGYGVLPENRDAYEAWNQRNRAASGIDLRTSHSYDGILSRQRVAFEKHPEYLTKPGGNKFCVSNPGLQQLVIDDALEQFEKNPELQSISLDPSDGGGWESDSCKDSEVFASITDRVVTLANMVAEAVTKKYPDKYVGIYAYGYHSPPPTINVHPRVVVSIATSFIRGGYTLDQLLSQWKEKASILGIREYYSVYVWDYDLPGKARGGNVQYIRTSIPDFYEKKARFLTSESSDSWGPLGLGHYIAARLLWDVDEASQVEALTDDFLSKAFGSARGPMAEFYRLIDGGNKPLLSPDLVGRMYRQLDKALQSTQDEAVHARLRDLTLYTRYVELYSAYSQAGGAAKQTAFEAVLRHSWRMRQTHMVHTLGIWRGLVRDKGVEIPAGSGYQVSEASDPWKSSEPFSPEQYQKMIADGIANNAILDFEVASFSDELVPARALNLTTPKRGSFPMTRGTRDFYTWVEKAPANISFQAVGGQIYQDRGDTRFTLYPRSETEGKSVAQQDIAPDKSAHEVQLATEFEGLHRVSMSDGTAGTKLDWPQNTLMVTESSLHKPTLFVGGRWNMFFYVPKGTRIVGGYRNGTGHLLDASGKKVLDLTATDNPGYWSVPVAPGQDGKLWQLSQINGQVMLMTVPPYLARSAQELLLPREVVEADTR